MIINYGANNYNFAYKKILSFNRNYNGLIDSIEPYINHRSFKRSYRINIFDTRYQRDHIGARAIESNFEFARGVAQIIWHAIVLTRRIFTVNSGGSTMVDIAS